MNIFIRNFVLCIQIRFVSTEKNYAHRLACILLVVFFFTEKNYLMSSLAMSVRPSVRLSVCPSVRPSVCPSSVEISLERGCSITNMPIDLKFGPIIGGRVMHVWKKFGFEIRIASCEFMQFKFFFVITVLTNLLFRFSWYLTCIYLMW